MIATEVGAPAYLSLFPAWGVLFGIGGSMMASSAQHEPEVDVIGTPAAQAAACRSGCSAIVAVPLMLWQGWGTETDENTFYVANLVFWIFPFLDPPGSTAAVPFVGGLWYLRACLWFVLLTPLMRAGLRRSPLVAVTLAARHRRARRLAQLGPVVRRRHGTRADGLLRLRAQLDVGHGLPRPHPAPDHPRVLGVLAVAALAGGALWTKLHVAGLAIDESPLSAALISVGAVILLLSVSPLMAWLDRVPVLRGLLGLITGRALTIYLCYPIAIAAAPLIAARLGLGTDARTTTFTAVGLTVLGVLAFGWVEDLSARRRLGLFPRAGQMKRKSKSAAAIGPPVSQVLPLPVPRQTGPPPLGPSGPQRVPVLQGAGGPPLAPPEPGGPQGTGPHRAVEAWSSGPHASGPHRRVGERTSGPNATGPHRSAGRVDRRPERDRPTAADSAADEAGPTGPEPTRVAPPPPALPPARPVPARHAADGPAARRAAAPRPVRARPAPSRPPATRRPQPSRAHNSPRRAARIRARLVRRWGRRHTHRSSGVRPTRARRPGPGPPPRAAPPPGPGPSPGPAPPRPRHHGRHSPRHIHT